MATVINNPSGGDTADSGMGFFLGMIVFFLLAVLFFVYGLPYLGNSLRGMGGSSVNVPGRIDVNIQHSK